MSDLLLDIVEQKKNDVFGDGQRNYNDIFTPQDIFIDDAHRFKLNDRNIIDGLSLLNSIQDSRIATCFFDPQYRGVMDKLSYGNEGSRQKKRAELEQMSEGLIIDLIQEIGRVLRPSGHLFLWVDKFHLCEGISDWIKNTNLEIVDLMVWKKMTFGMGYRSRRTSEYAIIIQKKPKRAKGVWTIRNIPDVWEERVLNKSHPHQKPIELQKRLIEATTALHDVVLDPAAGSYGVLEACDQLKRQFLGCDII